MQVSYTEKSIRRWVRWSGHAANLAYGTGARQANDSANDPVESFALVSSAGAELSADSNPNSTGARPTGEQTSSPGIRISSSEMGEDQALSLLKAPDISTST